MFTQPFTTPKKKTGVTTTPGGGVMNNFRSVKGKGVSFVDKQPPPPLGSLEGGEIVINGSDEDQEVWQIFREEGLLDEASLMKRDREALMERVSKLENEVSN
ncbi:hypothetical protein ACHQM5_029429 [Ranunculus cassubicifolius]